MGERWLVFKTVPNELEYLGIALLLAIVLLEARALAHPVGAHPPSSGSIHMLRRQFLQKFPRYTRVERGAPACYEMLKFRYGLDKVLLEACSIRRQSARHDDEAVRGREGRSRCHQVPGHRGQVRG
jgi:hypothetical protein